MLCAQTNIRKSSFDYFTLLLERAISQRNDLNSILDAILLETKELIEDRKTIYTISRNNFEIITFLSDNATDCIKNKTSFELDDYIKIQHELEKTQELSC